MKPTIRCILHLLLITTSCIVPFAFGNQPRAEEEPKTAKSKNKKKQAESKRAMVRILFYGRASQKAVKEKNRKMMRATCREVTRINASAAAMRYSKSSFTFEGTRRYNSLSLESSGRIAGPTGLGCRYFRGGRECTCTWGFRPKDVSPVWTRRFPQGRGYIDGDTAILTVRARSRRGLRSRLAKKASCIEATHGAAVKDLLFLTARLKGLKKKKLKVRSILPYTRTAKCRSRGRGWSRCSCRVMLHRKGLKERFFQDVKLAD